MIEYYCRVCGFNNYPDEFWMNNAPMHIICSCCECESGNEDFTIESTKQHREMWIKEGMHWVDPKERPKNWDRREQLKNILENVLFDAKLIIIQS